MRGGPAMLKEHLISDEELDTIAGGMLLDTTNTPEYDPDFPWSVIENNTGKVLGKFPTEGAAYYCAKSYGPEPYNAQKVDYETVLRLRLNPNVCP